MLIIYHFENRTLIDEMVCNWCFLGTNYFFCCKNLEIAKKCSIFASELVYTEIVTQKQYSYGYYRSLFEVCVILHDFG